MKSLFACVCPQIPCKDCLHWSGEAARRLFISLSLSLDLQKWCICNYFPLFLPHHYCTDLPLSLIFILVVHQELCFDIHVTAWLRCKRDSCEVLGHLLLLMCVFFTLCTAFILSSPLPSLVVVYDTSLVCVAGFAQASRYGCYTLCGSHNNPQFSYHHIIPDHVLRSKEGLKREIKKASFSFLSSGSISTAWTIQPVHIPVLWSFSFHCSCLGIKKFCLLACGYCWSGVRTDNLALRMT